MSGARTTIRDSWERPGPNPPDANSSTENKKADATSRRPFCWLGPLTAYFFFFAAFFLVAFFAVFFFAAMRVSPGLWFLPVHSPGGVVGSNRTIAHPVVRSRQPAALFCETTRTNMLSRCAPRTSVPAFSA